MTKIADKFKRLVIKVLFICQHFLFLLCRWSSDITLVTQYRLGLVRSGCKYFTLGFTNPLPIFFNLCALTTTNKYQQHPKVTGHQPSNPWKFHSNWPNRSKVNQHFPKHGITLTNWPLGTPRGPSNEKTKNMQLLKFYFQRGMFYKKLPN